MKPIPTLQSNIVKVKEIAPEGYRIRGREDGMNPSTGNEKV